MVLSYDYAKPKRLRRQTNAPPATTNECTSVTGHLDGHVEALNRLMQHRPMQHVQGYSESHWMPPSGDYSLHITPAAARAIANNTKM
jgi:hypothetical protein